MIEKKPFVSYTMEEDKKNPAEVGKIFTVRLNPEEYKQLQAMQKLFNIKTESTTLKFLAEIGQNVLLNTFGESKIRWLFSPKRRVLEEE